MGNVTALKGYRAAFTNGKTKLYVDVNATSQRIVRVISPYPNHRKGMMYKDSNQQIANLLGAGWKEIERREWKDVYTS